MSGDNKPPSPLLSGTHVGDPLRDNSDHHWCIHLSPCGEFFVWTAAAANWLRQVHHIVGRASLSTELSQCFTSGAHSSNSTPTCLPVHLSLEEVVFLLYRGFVDGIVQDLPVTSADPTPPSAEQLLMFHQALVQNAAETRELTVVKRRLQLVGHYRQLVDGCAIRRKRQQQKAGELCQGGSMNSKAKIQEAFHDSDSSIRKRRRTARLEKMHSRPRSFPDHFSHSSVETSYDSSTDDHATDKPLTVDDLMKNLDDGRVPSLREAAEDNEFGRSIDGDGSSHFGSSVMRHLPRPTPKEWLRIGEATAIPLPDALRSNSTDISSIAQWLLEFLAQYTSEHNVAPSISSVQDQAWQHNPRSDVTLMRCQVFEELHSHGFYITVAASKMGGDFLAYPADPLVCHASHLVLVCPPDAPISLPQLVARLRIANTIRKVLLLATAGPTPSLGQLDSNPAAAGHQIRSICYTSFRWIRANRFAWRV